MSNEKIEEIINRVILGESFLPENAGDEDETVEEGDEADADDADADELEEDKKECDDDDDSEDSDEDEPKSKKKGKFLAFMKKGAKKSDEVDEEYSKTVNGKGSKTINGKSDDIIKPTGDSSAKNKASIKSNGSKVTTEEVSTESVSIDTLFEGKDLTPEFKNEITVLFEAQLDSRVEEIEQEIQNKYETLLEEHTLAVTEEMVTRIDEYMDYVVGEWITENHLAVHNGLRTEITEGFIEKLRNVFTESYIEIPEEKLDLFESTVEDYEKVRSELDDQVTKNMEMNEENDSLRCELVFLEACDGLTATEAHKLRKLAESVEFDSVEQFAEKLAIILENIQNIGSVNESTDSESYDTESSEDSVEDGTEPSPLMESYIKSMDKGIED